MPLFDYKCALGHYTELVRPVTVERIFCPECGNEAARGHVHYFHVVGPTVDTRGAFRRFTEATEEIDHAYVKKETEIKRSIARPALYSQAKAKVQAMQAAGEAPVLKEP